MSASQIKALGDRIAKSAEASDEDRKLLQRLIADYLGPMALVQDRIKAELGIDSTARPKTEKTTIEKLRRDRTRLNKMQDLAGVRIVARMTLVEQDAMIARLADLFPGAVEDDLRERGGNPYRAVHIVTIVDDCPVEIQVRTALQHAWADVFERLADATDRRIRYGAVPRDTEARRLYGVLLQVSPIFREIEKASVATVESLSEGDRLHANMIQIGTVYPKGTPERIERDRLLRNLTDSRRRLRRRIEERSAIERTMVESLHSTARAIRDGRMKFERGIVELGA